MKKHAVKGFVLMVAVLFLSITVLEFNAHARAGGSRSSGSKTESVKFEEFWTFIRPVGNNPWQLTSISQA